jgi:4-hydroxy-tetrahydrodipicolinate synthase
MEKDMPKKYHGIIPPILTPVDAKENVDEEGFRALLEHCVNGGLHGIFVAGTNGEALALTQKERNNAIRIAIDQVNGRIPVVSGIMDSSTRRVIDNLKALEQMGGTCAVITSIFYDRHTSQDETIRHFEQISKKTNIDLLIYNIPPFTGLKLNAATIMEIAKFDYVVGYKDSSGAFPEFLQILGKFEKKDFCCLQGITPLALTSVLLGADGFVPALSPLFPELFVKGYEAACSKDIALTKKYDAIIRETSKILGMTKNATAANKFAISLLGYTNKRVIFPQDTICHEEEQQIIRKREEIEAMYAAL